MRSPEQLAEIPEGFWSEVFALDRTLHATAQEQSGFRWIRHTAGDWWAGIIPVEEGVEDPRFPIQDRRLAIRWAGTRTWGSSRIVGRLSVYQVLPTTAELPRDSDLSKPRFNLETRYMYGAVSEREDLALLFIAPHGIGGPVESQPSVTARTEVEGWEGVKENSMVPNREHYEAFLEEMRRGASGEYRMASSPPTSP